MDLDIYPVFWSVVDVQIIIIIVTLILKELLGLHGLVFSNSFTKSPQPVFE